MTCVKFSKRRVKKRDSDLPAFVSRSVVGVVLCDVSVYSIQCELLIWSHGDSLYYKLCVRIWRFGVILRRKEETEHDLALGSLFQYRVYLRYTAFILEFVFVHKMTAHGHTGSAKFNELSCDRHWAICRLECVTGGAHLALCRQLCHRSKSPQLT